MKVNFKKTKIIIESLQVYYKTLSNKQYRSEDELRLFDGLTSILLEIEAEQRAIERRKKLDELPTMEDNCEVCE